MKREDSPSGGGSLDGALALFIQELKSQIVTLTTICEGCNLKEESLSEVKAIIHKIKGAAGFFGMTELDVAVRKTQELVNGLKIESIQGSLPLALVPLLEQIKKDISDFN